MAGFAADCAKEVLGEEEVITYREFPNMGGEDFANYLLQIPGALMFLSTSNAEKAAGYAHHNPKFNIDEDVLWEGPAVFVKIAQEFLNRE